MKPIALLVSVSLASPPASVCAQTVTAPPPAPAPSAQVSTTPPVVPETPLSFARVQRRLAAAEVARPTEGGVLRIEEFINVYGKSMNLDVLRDYDVTSTAVQYGGMTHGEFLDVVTPRYFRQPTADLLGLAFGAAKWAFSKSSEKRKKAEQERIEAEAQRLRELGIIPPPR